jgi:hypothetical protein
LREKRKQKDKEIEILRNIYRSLDGILLLKQKFPLAMKWQCNRQEQNQFIVVLVCKLENNKNMATIPFVASQLNLSIQLINITLPKENFDAPR